MLNSLELTGQADTHVGTVAGLKCTLYERAGQALTAMREAARRDCINLEVVSGFRDFKHQVGIWTAKFTGARRLLDRFGAEIPHGSLDESGLIETILLWSALPGASRHHWGTEIDVIDAGTLPDGVRPQLVQQEFAAGGCFETLDRWLTANMGQFGFFRPYSTDRGGVQPEPWHLSYAPVSVPALEALSLEVLTDAIEGSNMAGKDAVLARLPELYRRYVLAVDGP